MLARPSCMNDWHRHVSVLKDQGLDGFMGDGCHEFLTYPGTTQLLPAPAETKESLSLDDPDLDIRDQ